MAFRQDAGRGRGNNSWTSPDGGLYFSILLEKAKNRPATDLAFLGGVAIADALSELKPYSGELTLKWPNDVLIGGKKVAGLLAELEGGSHVILGVGVNVSTAASDLRAVSAKFPPGVVNSFAGVKTTPEKLAKSLVARLAHLYDWYGEDGFEAIRERWLGHCPWVGRQIQVSTEPGKFFWSTFTGIDGDGALVLTDAEGKSQTLLSAEILCCSH